MPKYFVEEISKESEEKVYFTHFINRRSDGSYYLTETTIWADADLKRARRIEVKYCDQLAGNEDRIDYDEHRPIFKCKVPTVEATCITAGEK